MLDFTNSSLPSLDKAWIQSFEFVCFLNVCMQTLKYIYIYYWKVDTHIQNLGSTEGKTGKSDLAHITYSFIKQLLLWHSYLSATYASKFEYIE